MNGDVTNPTLTARAGLMFRSEKAKRVLRILKIPVLLALLWYVIMAGFNLARPLAWSEPSYFNIEHASGHGMWEGTKLRAKSFGIHPVVVERDWKMRATAYTAIDVNDRRIYYVYIPERALFVETTSRRW